MENIPNEEKPEEINYLEIGESFHCLRCHKDIPTKEWVAEDELHTPHSKNCPHEIKICGVTEGAKCEFATKICGSCKKPKLEKNICPSDPTAWCHCGRPTDYSDEIIEKAKDYSMRWKEIDP